MIRGFAGVIIPSSPCGFRSIPNESELFHPRPERGDRHDARIIFCGRIVLDRSLLVVEKMTHAL